MSVQRQSTVKANESITPLQAWFLAARPRTLPVSLPPIIVGTVLAAQKVEALNGFLILFALLCSLFIQIGTNLINDALDFKKGADGEGRLGPLRMTQGGFLTYQQVFKGGCICFGLALLCGIPLVFAGGWPILMLLCISIACGYLYTGGPFPLAYTGLSDLFVLIFFGWVSTGIVYYLQTGSWSWNCFLASTQIGFLAMVPHAINNLRDHAADAKVHKKTLAVRFGNKFARLEISFLSLIPFVLGFLWLADDYVFTAFLPFVCLPVVIRNVQAIWAIEPSAAYNDLLARSALCELIFGSLLALGLLLG